MTVPAPDRPRRSAPLRRPKRPDKAPKRGRDDWLDQARKVLIAEGVDRVKVDPLAKRLGVTTGSFYHHFRNRQELLDALLEDWKVRNSGPMFAAVEAAGLDAEEQIEALFQVVLTEKEYDPAYDAAVRAWAYGDRDVSKIVQSVDNDRIELTRGIFEKIGYDPKRAFVRARIAYFQQVGYQTINITETLSERRELYQFYRDVLVGDPAPRNSKA